MSKIDNKVEQLLKLVEEKRSKLGSKPNKTLETNGIFKFNNKEHMNINVVNDIDSFVELYAYLLNDFKMKAEAAQALKIDNYKYFFSGFTINQWQNDITYKVDLLKWNEKNKDLQKYEQMLASFMSEEKKAEKELLKLEELLKG